MCFFKQSTPGRNTFPIAVMLRRALMITQLSSGGREWRANNYHPAALERPWLAWASHEEGAGTPRKEIKDIAGTDKNESPVPRYPGTP